MQNLEAYQNIELQKQLAKIQIIGTFQGYLKKVLSLSSAQQVILQKAGISSAQFDGINGNGRNPLLQPTYFDPATIFGPSLALLNAKTPQLESRPLNAPITNNIIHQNNISQSMAMAPQFSFPGLPTSNRLIINPAPAQTLQNPQSLSHPHNLLELPPLPIKKKLESTDSDELNDFFQKKVSNASTNYSCDVREDEIDTGKKITLEKEIQIQNPGQPTQKARKRTKVICGHPWKNHHAKGLCKNCYETYGKTRKPWKCDHQAHFAKGYCKKCYLRLRQKISVKDIFPFAIEEFRKRVENKKDSDEEAEAENKMDFEIAHTNVKEEAV